MSGTTSYGDGEKLSFFRVLRELRGPLSALAVLMLVLNVSFVGGVSLANAGPGSITLITCLNPDRGNESETTGEPQRHDCISCCLSTAKALSAPAVPAVADRIDFVIATVRLPADARPAEPSRHAATPIRAPPVFS